MYYLHSLLTHKLVESEDDYIFYECRGDVMYDDAHDEIPEPSLWRAAMQLQNLTYIVDYKL